MSQRYRKSQIKAAVKVNGEMLRFYWSLGYDIVQKKAEAQWGNKFFKNLSADLRKEIPDATCFSETNLKYMKYFYEMFPVAEIRPQVGDELQTEALLPQSETVMWDKIIRPQVGDELENEMFFYSLGTS